ncbi:uncharacterized protein LOC144325190, partial [Podarcis muralis]
FRGKLSGISLFFSDTVAAHPSGPWLSLLPPHNTFARGELASLMCSLPEGQRATEFYFYEKRGGVPVMYGQQAENILEVSTKYLETNKTFVCAYLGEKSSGGLFRSSLSNEVVLSITDLPRAPVFSVSPKKDVYTSGESVELKCSSSETRHVSRTQFFRDQLDLYSVKPSFPSSLNNITHTLRLVIQDGGDYSCRYHIVESGREIASRESNSIRISLPGEEVFLCNTDLLEVEVGSWIETEQFGWSKEEEGDFINRI